MKKVLFTFIFVLILTNTSMVRANGEDVTIVYFYTTTCSSCQKITSYFSDLQNKYNNITLKKYNIIDLKNKALFGKYNEAYNVDEEDDGIVPVVFIKNIYLTGEKNIIQNIESLINRVDGINTIEFSEIPEDYNRDISKFSNFKVISVFFAGLINGINPCSMSMLLFFLSLIIAKKANIIKIGMAFCLGKFIMYFLLGTIFFNFLSKINIEWFSIIIKYIMIIVIIILIFLNIKDYFYALNEEYGKIKLQLPIVLRKLNHTIIKRVTTIDNLNFVLPISFFLGSFISLGEFLCTGQIYLATILTILHTNTQQDIYAFLYLIIYDFAFIIPLLTLTLIVYKGKEVFDVSEKIREKLHVIKFINILLFVIIGIIVIFYA